MHGLSLHNYTVPGEWQYKGSATEFNEAQWLITMKKAARMEELVQKHGKIMDEFDPQRRIGLIVDEWGAWHEVEKGTNPGFLYQQNTMRDAIIAAIHLNIFNNYAERVRMANIAQTINVLQSVILTEGQKMILTPTYHIFDMYKVHHDAIKLPVYLESESAGDMPALCASASRDGGNHIHISLVNIDPVKAQGIKIELPCSTISSSIKITGQLLTSEKMQEHNTFEKPDTVVLKDFNGSVISGGAINVEMPPKSVITLAVA